MKGSNWKRDNKGRVSFTVYTTSISPFQIVDWETCFLVNENMSLRKIVRSVSEKLDLKNRCICRANGRVIDVDNTWVCDVYGKSITMNPY